MAGGSRKSRDAGAPPARVEDGELFPFNADSIGPTSPSRPTAQSGKASAVAPGADRPHYHQHRERLREKFDAAGPVALADYELLELMLFRIIPRQDTKPLAKKLLDTFGDLAAVLAAPVHRIAEVEGAGSAVARDLKIVQAVLERASKAAFAQRTIISSWAQLVNYCRMSMAHEPREQFRVLYLDAKNQLIGDEVTSRGTVNHAAVYPREVVRRALELSAAAIILVHNHPTH